MKSDIKTKGEITVYRCKPCGRLYKTLDSAYFCGKLCQKGNYLSNPLLKGVDEVTVYE